MEPSVKRTADMLSIGVATVKSIIADYNRDPILLVRIGIVSHYVD